MKFCILTDEKDIIEQEKKLFDTYMKKNQSGWVVNNYIKIDNCRLRAKIPYNDQTVYAVKKNDDIIAGGALNFNISKFMLKEMGFEIDKNIENACEGINLYATDDIKGDDVFKVFSEFINFIINDLKKRKIYTVYGTCERHMKAMYSLLGFQILDKKIVQGIKQYFMIYKINI